jgi:hypothetical protein
MGISEEAGKVKRPPRRSASVDEPIMEGGDVIDNRDEADMGENRRE